MQPKGTLSVCHVISGDLWAGAEVMAYNLLKSLREHNDIRLSAVVLNRGELSEKIKDLNIDIKEVDESEMSFPILLKKIRHILKESQPDVIHTHRYKENLLGYLASQSNRDVKLVATQHGSPEKLGGIALSKSTIMTKFNFFILSRCFDRIVAVSKALADELNHRYGVKRSKIETIHNGIPLPKARKKSLHGDFVVIGSAGRLYPVKDFPLMVDIARSVTKKTNRVRFELAGDGPEFQKLEMLVHNYGLSQIFKFKGFIKDQDAFYNSLDLYLNTSFHEGIPMSVLEAMAYGLPVIAPEVGGLPEIITNATDGYLVKQRSLSAFEEKCLLLATNSHLREKMSIAAKRKIENNFLAERMASRYHELYREVVNP